MASSPTRAEPAERSVAAGHLRNVLGALAVAATDLLTEDAQASGYHPAEHAAIILVGTVDGLSQEDLQRRLGLSQPGTTRLVDRLAARGLLTRAPGPDRRTNALRLTTAGAREAERALARRHELLGPLVAGLDHAELQAAAELIERMLATLVRSGRSPWRICRDCDQAACDAGQCQCPVEATRRQLADSGQPDPGNAGATPAAAV
jgi:MarR family transcriptional regulator, negative regulator of the multidrug operon emrRAB